MKRHAVVGIIALVALSLGMVLSAEAKKGEHVEGVVNVNTATAEELTLIPGIGPSKAEAIVAFRETQKFATTEDLIKVKGIGEKLFVKIQPYVTVEGPTTAKLVKENKIKLETPTAGERS